jgi:alkanesulfonate monooxygenase SsuD/methylene tetrahydromethanopterin reductase-like flavin-dependent oxidoreductase (luciferase family)
MKIGIDSLVAILPDPLTGRLPSATARKAELLQEVELADQVGLNVFGIGEHHRIEFLDSARAIILSAVAARNSQIRLTCAVTVLSAADHVRLFEKLSILDLIVNDGAESVVGRGSFHEAFPLFGLDTRAYDYLFADKLNPSFKLGETTNETWDGRFRAALSGQVVFPRPYQTHLPLWI